MNEDQDLHAPTPRRVAPYLLPVLAGLLAVATIARLPAAWESGNALNHVSGAWMTLADDLARGTFYRPLAEPDLGFGGTRFFPLAFVLHAGLLRLGVPLLPAGFALSALAGLLLVGGAYALLRGLGLARATAALFATLALAGFAGQHALSAVRGDLLAVALQAVGLAWLTRASRPATRGLAPVPDGPPPLATRLALPLAALSFTLAFATKPTALTAPAAACAWLVLRGERRRALALAAGVGAGALAVVALTEALSAGRFLALLAACAAGGAGAADLLRAPVRLASELWRSDRSGAVLLGTAALALAVAARAPGLRRRLRAGDGLGALWLGAAGGGALVVFASPGTAVNHLLELEVASAVVLAACAASAAAAARTAARWGATAAALAGVVMATWFAATDARTSRRAELAAVAARLPAAPVLAEDPLVPLLRGERPVLTDAWMLRLVSSRDPALARPLLDAIRARRVGAVVLLRTLDAPDADDWFAVELGPRVAAELRAAYRLEARVGRYALYVPRAPATPREAPGAPRVAVADGERSAQPVPAAGPRVPEPPAGDQPAAALRARTDPSHR